MGRKTDFVSGWKIFILVFIILKFFEFSGPPFENPAYTLLGGGVVVNDLSCFFITLDNLQIAIKITWFIRNNCSQSCFFFCSCFVLLLCWCKFF